MASTTQVSYRSDFSRQLAIFRKRLWMIVLLFAVTLVVILVQALSAPPVYRATVRLQVIPMESEQVALYGQPPVGADVDLTAFVFREVVRSMRGLLAAGITRNGRLRIDHDRPFRSVRIDRPPFRLFPRTLPRADSSPRQ